MRRDFTIPEGQLKDRDCAATLFSLAESGHLSQVKLVLQVRAGCILQTTVYMPPGVSRKGRPRGPDRTTRGNVG
jgi:hypothetical protein